MIEVRVDICTGCGRCVDVCSEQAIRIVEGHAAVDGGLCRSCWECVDACPEGALVRVAAPVAVAQRPQPLARRSAAVIDVTPKSKAVLPWRQRMVPVLAAAASFAGREILPRMLDMIASRAATEQAGASEPAQRAGRLGSVDGQRARSRHRGRRGRG